MSPFFNSNYELRAGWKFALYVVAFFAIGWITVELLTVIYPYLRIPEGEVTAIGVSVLIRFVPSVLAMLFMVRFVDHVPVAAFGVVFHERWLRDLITGVAVAGGMLAALVVGSAFVGGLQIRWTGPQPSFGLWAVTIAILLFSAASEELMFRGYPMQILMKGMGAWPAMIVMSTLFGVLHMFNPDASLRSTFNTVIAGVMLSLAYFKTRSLWFPYGIHVAWNLSVGPIVGFAISGVNLPSLWTARLNGPEMITGGGYGPEGGFLGTLVFACGLAAVHSIVKVHVSPLLRATIARNAGKLYASDLN
jgi:membrane protease YdiL (CAAX protease family)